MTYWEVQADYRPMNVKSPVYLFLSDTGRTEHYVRRAFLRRYPALKNIRVREMEEDEMEQQPGRIWISWI